MARKLAVLALSGALLTITAGPAAAHQHTLTITSPGTGEVHCVQLPVEPDHVHATIHPLHWHLHKGPGAPADTSTVVPGGDPVQVASGTCS